MFYPMLCPDVTVRYCKRIYKPETESSGVFLTLLRIYLRPTEKTAVDLLPPALDLISRHSPRLDSVKVLQLLPPLVTTDSIRAFLFDSLRAPVFDARVVGDISKARSDQLSRKLMALQTRRVKVTDSRMYVTLFCCSRHRILTSPKLPPLSQANWK